MNRRHLITGLVSLIAAPAIVRCSSLMQVRGIVMPAPVYRVAIPSLNMFYWMGAGGLWQITLDGEHIKLGDFGGQLAGLHLA